MKRRTGFAFDYSPEIAKGRIITLREDIGRRINVTDDIKSSENKLIIGDNYNALKALLITHKNSIDIIYIDPPYNTESAKNDGNNDSYKDGSSSKFIYKDKFGRCGWLNMMKDRLTLAKDLLTDCGVIFVSIDDSEQAYLKVLMDDIFGENNFLSNIILDKRNAQNDAKHFESNHEYIITYRKSINFVMNKTFEKNINKGKTFSLTIGATGGGLLINRKKLGWTLYFNDKTKEKIAKLDYDPNNVKVDSDLDLYQDDLKLINNGFIAIRPPFKNNVWQCWTWSLEKGINDIDKIIPKKTKNGWTLHYEDDRDLKQIPHKSIITTINGKKSIKELGLDFDYPKSENLILELIKKHSNKNALILDFFAGSGTTGHAVMNLNNNDGGNRKFILCTNNENNIAHSVTYERLHRIIKGEDSNGETNFDWLKQNEPYKNSELRVINIDDSVRISLDAKIDNNIFEDCKNGLKLLNNKYNKKDLNLYYDLAALNPLEKDCE